MMTYIARTTSINDNGEYINIVVTANNDADAMREIDRIAAAGKHEIAFIECEPQQDDEITAEPDETETETENNEQEETKMKNAEFIAQVRAILGGRKCRSAWDRGVMQYAEELTAELAENINGGYITLEQLTTAEGRKAALLNGAKDWSQYSYGGSALIYDYDIAERLCNQSELKRTRGGERNPNSRETWLDCQARALSQASSKVRGIIRGVLYDLGMEVH